MTGELVVYHFFLSSEFLKKGDLDQFSSDLSENGLP